MALPNILIPVHGRPLYVQFVASRNLQTLFQSCEVSLLNELPDRERAIRCRGPLVLRSDETADFIAKFETNGSLCGEVCDGADGRCLISGLAGTVVLPPFQNPLAMRILR